VIAERDAPSTVLFAANTLKAVAECLVAQPSRSGLIVSVNDAGSSRTLGDEDRRRLAELMG
jgi:hypothetical protein